MKNRIFSVFIALTLILSAHFLHAQTGKDAALTALGGTCGAHIYNTYLSIGAVADIYADEGYTAETVQELMEEQIGSASVLIEQYKALIKSGFLTDPSDKEYMQEIVVAMELLTKQATALRDYTNGAASAEDFQAARENSWNKIAELLGLD